VTSPPVLAPLVMGVMNLTPDSFSDGGRIQGVAQALRQAGRLLAQGAAVLDLGGQSTRPGAEEVGAALLERLASATSRAATRSA